MGIKIIGGNPSGFGSRVQRGTGRVSIRTDDAPTVELRPITVEHVSDGPDNADEPNLDGQATSVDPTSISGADSGSVAGTGKRRGRKPGSRNKSSGNATSSDPSKTASSLATMICMLHGVAANIVKIPALAISLEDSKLLTQASLEVAQLYDVPLPTEKVAAWMNLGAVAYKVYFVSDKPKPFVVRTVEASDSIMPDFMTGRAN